MQKKTILIAVTATLAVATSAGAHRAWMLPSVTVLSSTNQMVTVDAATSTNPFFADHNAMNTDAIKVWAPDGTMGKIENAAKGRYRSTFDVAINKPGTWRIGSMASNVSGTFKVNGEDWAVGRRRPGGAPGAAPGAGGPGAGAPGAAAMATRPTESAAARPPMAPAGAGEEGEGARRRIDPSHMVASVAEIPAGATDLDLTESTNRNEFFVTAGAPTKTVLQPTNKGLEMMPITHPDELVSNEPGKFRFLIDGKPAANIKVAFVPGAQRFRDAEHAQDLISGADGVVTVQWPVAGFYWMNATASDDKPSAAKATKRRMSYTATLEVVAP